ncbi:hypothetical protein GTY75_09100 [Streptomyces sp. SID8381]|uniref:hypothetical protein n=1 Tax=unclassified Streptomyces TaxID=2593676 RepID=UPI000376CA18|nr:MULTISPECIES: hypothetical protein [unclassified Streptomyces]MYX26823.1 hypothetical protein [Streptomyces sp. SID8381]
MTALTRAALRLARSRLPDPPGAGVPQYLSPADALHPLSDHALWELREDIDRELEARAYVALTDALRWHLRESGLFDHDEQPAVAATFTVTTRHPDGPWWDEAAVVIRYADGFEQTVDFAGTTVDDELVELVLGGGEHPEPGDVLTVPLLIL